MRTRTRTSAEPPKIDLCLVNPYQETALKQPFLVAGAGIAAHHGNDRLDVKGDVMRESALATPEILSASRSRPQGRQLARYQSNPRRDCTVIPVWLRGLAVLLILSIVGCAGTNRAKTYEPEPRFHLPAGAKIALTEGHFDKKLFDQEINNAKRANGPLIQSPGVGAVAGAGLGAVGGGLYGAIYGLSCGPLVVVCAPLFAAVGVVGGSVVGAVKGAQVGAENAARYSKDKSKDAGSAEQSSDIATDAKVKAALQLIEKSLTSLAPIPERVQHLVAPLSGQPDYMLEIAALDTKFAHEFEKTLYFSFTARGRIVRLSDNAVVDRFRIYEPLELIKSPAEQLPTSLTPENAKIVNSKLESALNELARRFVDEWMTPSGGAISKRDSSAAIPATTQPPKEQPERALPAPTLSRNTEIAKEHIRKDIERPPTDAIPAKAKAKPSAQDSSSEIVVPTPSDSPFPSKTNPHSL